MYRLIGSMLFLLLMLINVNAQFTTHKPMPTFAVLGQSNAGEYVINGGYKVLSDSLENYLGIDTFGMIPYFKSGTYLAEQVALDWNVNSHEFADSIAYYLNGDYHPLAPNLITSQSGSAIGEMRNKYYEGKETWNASIEFVIWIQGEADAQFLTTASTYETSLRDLLAKIRSDLNNPNLKIYLVELGAPITLSYKSDINTAFANIALDDINTVVIDMDDMDAGDYYDPVHMNLTGTTKVSQKIFNIIRPLP